MPRARVMEVVTDVVHPKTGELILDEETIVKQIARHKGIKKWSYILHDKDPYTEEDERKNPNCKAGTLKPPHWHIPMQFGSSTDIDTVAGWFNVAPHFVDIKNGQNALIEAVEYITHEHPVQQLKGKYLYPDEEVKANFDFRAEITAYHERKSQREKDRERYGADLSERDKMRYEVMYNGRTLRECIEIDRLLYMNDFEKLQKLRLNYIYRQAPPATRMNFYISGRGGVGKGLMSRAIARSLFPQYKDDDDIFFIVGASNVSFEGYDGQPVIIWDDKRAVALLKELGGRGNVFNIFDTHPTKQRQNVKNSSVNLCNVVNIVNSVESYEDFLNGLAGGYTDKNGNTYEAEDSGQSYRRFPIIMPLHEDDFDMLLNRGFIENTAAFQEYIEYKHIRGNMQRLAVACADNKVLLRKLEASTVQLVTDKYNEIISKQSQELSEDEILEIFKGYGKPISGKEYLRMISDDITKRAIEEYCATELRQYGCAPRSLPDYPYESEEVDFN